MMNAQELQGNWNELKGKVKEKWAQLTQDDLMLVHGNVDQLIGRIEKRTGETRQRIEEFISGLVPDESTIQHGMDLASDYVQSAAETVQEGFEQVSEHAREGYRRAQRLVERHPAESLAAIFGTALVTGFVVGLLVCSESSSHDTWRPW